MEPSRMASEGPLSDDELLALVRQAEARERAFAALAAVDDEDEEPQPEGDTCAHCGEVARGFDDCSVCGRAGCLPRDDWRPGWADPCLARCARCGNLAHWDCADADHVGNPLCGTCAP